jgi:hypothetical protein
VMPFRVFRNTGASYLALEGPVSSHIFRTDRFRGLGRFRLMTDHLWRTGFLLLSPDAETDQQYLSDDDESLSDRSLPLDTAGGTEDLSIYGCPQGYPFNSHVDLYFTHCFGKETLGMEVRQVPCHSLPEIHPLSKRPNAADRHLNIDGKCGNRVIDTILLERYRHQLGGDQNSNINSCLTYTFLLHKIDVGRLERRDLIYGEYLVGRRIRHNPGCPTTD